MLSKLSNVTATKRMLALSPTTCLAQRQAFDVPVVDSFVDAAARLTDARSVRLVVFDVGANTGTWSASMFDRLENATRRIGGPRAELHIFEPQPRFTPRLKRLADRNGATFHAKAAWTNVTQLRFFESINKEMASLRLAMAMRKGVTRSYLVETVDLAQYVRGALRADRRPALALLKLDVESAEFDVLPALLARGVLCELTHVYVEWHLNAIDASRRLAGVGLQLGIEETLRRGCSGGGPAFGSEPTAFETNNLWVPVPGLDEEAERHRSGVKGHGAEFLHWKNAHKSSLRKRGVNVTGDYRWR